MAIETHTTTSFPGASPFNPVVVDRRPLSYADALAQYRWAKDAEKNAPRYGEDVFDTATDSTMARFIDLMETPAPDIAALADKMQIACDEWEGEIDRDSAGLLIADLRRIGGMA